MLRFAYRLKISRTDDLKTDDRQTEKEDNQRVAAKSDQRLVVFVEDSNQMCRNEINQINPAVEIKGAASEAYFSVFLTLENFCAPKL